MQYIAVGETSPRIYSAPRVVVQGRPQALQGAPSSVSATARLGGTLLDGLTVVDVSDTRTTSGATAEGSTTILLQYPITARLGAQILILDPDTSESLIVESAGLPDSSTLTLREPLPRAVPDGCTVSVIDVAVDLPSTAVDEVHAGEHGIVVFTATVDGKLVRWEESFRIVRRVSSVVLTPTRLTQLYPSVRGLRGTSDVDYEEAIQAAWDVVVVPLLAAKGVLHEDIITDDVIEPLHAIATVLHLARQWRGVEADYVARLEASYEQVKTTTFARIDLAIRDQADETPAEVAPGSEPNRGIMRVRR